MDIPHPVFTTGAGWIAPVGRISPAGEPDRVPYLAIHYDLGDRAGSRDGCARSAGDTRGIALHFRDVFSQHGRRGGPRRSVVLPVTDVSNDLRCGSSGHGAADEILGRRPGG